MTVAWGLLAPAGILLALFYKVVWPNGEWFYVSQSVTNVMTGYVQSLLVSQQAHIVIMCSAIVMTLAGIVVIVVHAGGKWLTSTVSAWMSGNGYVCYKSFSFAGCQSLSPSPGDCGHCSCWDQCKPLIAI